MHCCLIRLLAIEFLDRIEKKTIVRFIYAFLSKTLPFVFTTLLFRRCKSNSALDAFADFIRTQVFGECNLVGNWMR